MINDPALGKTKAQRAGLTPNPRSRNMEFRNVSLGQYTAPKPSYQRYNVSEQAQDILNKQLRTYNR
jgi:hypothetical protein